MLAAAKTCWRKGYSALVRGTARAPSVRRTPLADTCARARAHQVQGLVQAAAAAHGEEAGADGLRRPAQRLQQQAQGAPAARDAGAPGRLSSAMRPTGPHAPLARSHTQASKDLLREVVRRLASELSVALQTSEMKTYNTMISGLRMRLSLAFWRPTAVARICSRLPRTARAVSGMRAASPSLSATGRRKASRATTSTLDRRPEKVVGPHYQ